jgi:hypothetical protein
MRGLLQWLDGIMPYVMCGLVYVVALWFVVGRDLAITGGVLVAVMLAVADDVVRRLGP